MKKNLIFMTLFIVLLIFVLLNYSDIRYFNLYFLFIEWVYYIITQSYFIIIHFVEYQWYNYLLKPFIFIIEQINIAIAQENYLNKFEVITFVINIKKIIIEFMFKPICSIYMLIENKEELNLSLSHLFKIKTLIIYIIIKIVFKLRILTKLFFKTIIKKIILRFLYLLNKTISIYLKSYLINHYISQLSFLIVYFMSNYMILKLLILVLCCNISIIIPLFKTVYQFIIFVTEFYFNKCSHIFFSYFDIPIFNLNITNTYLPQMNISLMTELNNIINFVISFFIIIYFISIIIICGLWLFKLINLPFKWCIKLIMAVIPLSLLNEETLGGSGLDSKSESESESESKESQSETENEDENKGWCSTIFNFSFLSIKDRITYVTNKMELKGLTINPFLIHYFIEAIIKNTSGFKIDVDNFLNMNLNTILNDQRNIQLNNHAFTRIKPILLNNSNKSDFASIVPFKPDNLFKIELEEELENMKESHKLSEYGSNK